MDNFKLIFCLALCFGMLFNFVSADKITGVEITNEGLDIIYQQIFTYPYGENISFLIWASNSSSGITLDNITGYCIYSLTNNLGELLYRNENVSYDGQGFEVGDIPCVYCFHDKILSGNFTRIGVYNSRFNCRSYDGTLAGTIFKRFEITNTGESLNGQYITTQIFFILFFFSIALSFYFLKKNINLEKWNNSIIKKYQNKNYVKLVLSSIGYNVMKNSFIIYYLLFLPILLILIEISSNYILLDSLELFKAIFIVYSVGIILVGIVFLSYIQEWFMDLLEKVKNMEWGFE